MEGFLRGRVAYPVAWEDDAVDTSAYYGDGVVPLLVVVASGGDNALNALAGGVADRVIAVDQNPAQLYLTELKAASALRLTRRQALHLFGRTRGALREVWPSLRPALSPEAVAWWESRGLEEPPLDGSLTGCLWLGFFCLMYLPWLASLLDLVVSFCAPLLRLLAAYEPV